MGLRLTLATDVVDAIDENNFKTLPEPWRSDLEVAQALSRVESSGAGRSKRGVEEALSELERVVDRDPKHVLALYEKAGLLLTAGRTQEALRAAEKAAALSPSSVHVRQRLWWAIVNSPLSQEEKQRRLSQDVAGFREGLPGELARGPSLEWSLGYRYADLHMQPEAEAAKHRVRERWPTSPEAQELAVATRRSAIRRWHKIPRDRPERCELGEWILDRLDRFLEQDIHDPVSEGEALYERVIVASGCEAFHRGVLPKALSEFLHGTTHRPQRYVTVSSMALRHGVDADVVLQVLEAAPASVDRWSRRTDKESLMGQIQTLRVLAYLSKGELSLASDALEEAESKLGEVPMVLRAKAELAMKKGDLEAARDALVGCFDYEDRCRELITELYEQQGSPSSFQRWQRDLLAAAKEKRRQRVLEARIHPGRPVPPGQLATLAGKRVEVDTLAVPMALKFFSSTCRPCVEEAKHFETLTDEAGINLVIAIVDPKTEKASAILDTAGFTGTVLHAEEYSVRAEITIFPTTWFVDEDGRIAFDVRGSSSNLAEEYGWRWAAIKSD